MSSIIVVDVQNDFCEGGSLPVPNSLEILESINKEVNSGKYDLVVFTQDWHPQNHVSFASNHPGKELFSSIVIPKTGLSQTLWPDHCVQDTNGAQLHPGLTVPDSAKLVKKGNHPDYDCYSGFGMPDVSPTNLEELLKTHGIKEVTIVGLAYDYCVAATAADALKLGYKTKVLEDLTRGINKERVLQFKEKFIESGGLILKLDQA